MPERPDLAWQLGILEREVVGLTITEARVHDPVVLRMAVLGDFGAHLPGRTITGIRRRAHFVCFELSEVPETEALELVVHPMLAGRFQLVDPGRKVTKDTGAAWTLSDGRQLRYRDNKQMGKIYVIPKGDYAVVPGLAKVGVDVLDSKAFTFAAFKRLASKRRDQVKVFLLDKSALDAFGNAYADEVMWEARIHPKAWVKKLDEDELKRLHRATSTVLTEAIAEVAKREPPLEDKVRDFLKVRNRKGEACPRCGDPIRTCGVHGHDAFFCATCQPDGRGSGLVSWRRPG